MKAALLLSQTALVLALAVPAAGASPGTADASPSYAGQEAREIKALSPDQIAGLLAGKGMGYGKSAELNQYPGPAHVLELARELQLTEAQLQASRDIHARMQEHAKAVGARLVDAEVHLEHLFRSGHATKEQLGPALETIGQLQAELRGVHLNAHIEQRGVLSDEQLERYAALRGYAAGAAGAHHGH